jgi:hypothetical protein
MGRHQVEKKHLNVDRITKNLIKIYKKKFWDFKKWKEYIDVDKSSRILSAPPVIVLEYVKTLGNIFKTFYFIKNAVSKNGLVLEYCNTFNDNIFIVQIAVEQNGLALKFASDRLKKNINIVKPAVEQNGLALNFANPFYKDYKYIVQIAVKQNALALKFASDRLKKDKEILDILGNYSSLIDLTINNVNDIQQQMNQREEDVCAICLGKFNKDKSFDTLSCCKKNIHCECLRKWRKNSTICPNCRGLYNMTNKFKEFEEPSEDDKQFLSDSLIEWEGLPENDYRKTLYNYISDSRTHLNENPETEVEQWEHLWRKDGKEPPFNIHLY